MNGKRSFPREIEIAPGVFYRLIWKRNLGKNRGEAWTDHKVLLEQGHSLEDTYETIAHEILHCIEYEWGIKIPHNLIYKIEKGLGFILRRNFVWVKWDEERRDQKS
jgi:hypothetical protein